MASTTVWEVVTHILTSPLPLLATLFVMILPFAIYYLAVHVYGKEGWSATGLGGPEDFAKFGKDGTERYDKWKRGENLLESDQNELYNKELQEAAKQRDAYEENMIIDEDGNLVRRTPEELGGVCDTYRWLQTDNEIVVEAACALATKGKDCKVVFGTNTLSVHLHGEEVLAGKLFKSITTDDCFWELDERKSETAEGGKEKVLVVTLSKAEPTRGNKHWRGVVKGGPTIDTAKFGPPVIPVSGDDPQALLDALN